MSRWSTAFAAIVLTVSSAQAAPTEREILLEFYAATGGPSWNQQTGWEDDSSNICEWYGVTCQTETSPTTDDEVAGNTVNGARFLEEETGSQQGGVIGLALKSNNLSGRTPASLFQLPYLQSIYLSYNSMLDVSFQGAEYSKTLQEVKIHTTATSSLSGISGLSKTLTALHISGTELGNIAIPDEIFLLTNLQFLHMTGCGLEGTISDEIANLLNLEELEIIDNDLTGPIPSGLQSLENLRILELSQNSLSGKLPSFLGDMTKLEGIYMENNQLDGPLITFERLVGLQHLFLKYNALSGSIPTNFLAGIVNGSQSVVTVDLTGNELTSTVPSSLDALENIPLKLILADNLLTGIDSSLCDNSKWMAGAVASFQCDAILCPKGYYNSIGRRTSDNECLSCASGTTAVGQTYCLKTDDRLALAEFFNATAGTKWKRRDNWLNTNVEVCDWYGITCWNLGDEKDGHVKTITLDNNNLNGSIPSAIYALNTLTTISVSHNNVTMPFDGIGRATSIQKINIASTSTTIFDGIEDAGASFQYLIADKLSIGGNIPTEIFQVTSLKLLSMANCDISGEFNWDIARLSNLEELYLYDNSLRGVVPDSLEYLSNLRILSLAKNRLTGWLPYIFGNMTNLQALSLNDQVSKGGGISGQLQTFEENSYLTTLLLSNNLLTGLIPEDLLKNVDPEAAVTVDLSSNGLLTTLPGGLARFMRMNLFVANNQITHIDDGLCVSDDWMNGMVRDYGCDAILCPKATASASGRRIFDNEKCVDCTGTIGPFLGQVFCGFPVPILPGNATLGELFDECGGPNWLNNENWKTNKSVCEWYGISCDDAGSIVSIALGSNNLKGTLPSLIYRIVTLEHLSLFSNDIEVSFSGIEHAKNLQSLVLDKTGLRSLEGIGDAQALTELNVQYNSLEGTIPSELFGLVNLESLQLSNNKLAGSLPSELNNLVALNTFLAANNDFSGPLFDFTGLNHLIFLDLSYNKITGPVPETFLQDVEKTEKVFVDLSANAMTGTVPATLQRLERLTIRLKDNKIEAVDPALCTVAGWNDYDVETYGCDGLLCPVGSFGERGRQTSDQDPCEPCDKNKYMGGSQCGSGAWRQMASLLTMGSIVATTMFLVL